MLAAISACRDAVADMVPEVPRGIEASKKVTEYRWIHRRAQDGARSTSSSARPRTSAAFVS